MTFCETVTFFGASYRRPQLYYVGARSALKVSCLDGRSPMDGENSTSPVIESGASNFPLNVKVPALRPTLPRRNSTVPDNVIEFSSP